MNYLRSWFSIPVFSLFVSCIAMTAFAVEFIIKSKEECNSDYGIVGGLVLGIDISLFLLLFTFCKRVDHGPVPSNLLEGVSVSQ